MKLVYIPRQIRKENEQFHLDLGIPEIKLEEKKSE